MAGPSALGAKALSADLNSQALAFRRMTASDVSVVTQIEIQVSPHPWRQSEFVDSHAKHSCLVATIGGIVVGYAIYHVVIDEAEILNIAIDPVYQGRGYGRQLLDHLIAIVSAEAERFFLEVRISNDRAIQLYNSAGFVEVCLRKNYYQTDSGSVDAILKAMEL